MSGASERRNTIVNDGCEVASSCFICPLPDCKYDGLNAVAVKQAGVQARYDEIIACHYQGMTNAKIAERFGVSERTVERALDKRRNVA